MGMVWNESMNGMSGVAVWYESCGWVCKLFRGKEIEVGFW